MQESTDRYKPNVDVSMGLYSLLALHCSRSGYHSCLTIDQPISSCVCIQHIIIPVCYRHVYMHVYQLYVL
jgi:hypothetical protein